MSLMSLLQLLLQRSASPLPLNTLLPVNFVVLGSCKRSLQFLYKRLVGARLSEIEAA